MTRHLTIAALAAAAIWVVGSDAPAVAAQALFLSAAGFPVHFTVKGASALVLGDKGGKLSCVSSLGAGLLLGKHTLSNLLLTFHGCLAGEGTPCDASGPSEPSLLVLFGLLAGEIGTVKAEEAATGVGVLLFPQDGSSKRIGVFHASCAQPELVLLLGNIAGEATPVAEGQVLVEQLNFTGLFNESIKTVQLLGEFINVKLGEFGAPVNSFLARESFSYPSEIEVC